MQCKVIVGTIIRVFKSQLTFCFNVVKKIAAFAPFQNEENSLVVLEYIQKLDYSLVSSHFTQGMCFVLNLRPNNI